MIFNHELPAEVQQAILAMDPGDAIPLGVENDEPMILLRLSDGAEALLDAPELECDFKPTFLLMPFDGKTIGVCIVQFRLNKDDNYIFTTHYDITDPKMYESLKALLKMDKYNVIIATVANHTGMPVETKFVRTFDPLEVLEKTKSEAQNEAGDGMAYHIFNGMIAQIGDYPTVWHTLEALAPARKEWLLQA
ncbi:hypothetical protein WCX49_07770 [Sulfurimonas sp. HSL-1656]|uniref:hypothetical protein n=1 Tax=Thiomicrolovo TaxID=3451667 RepID=UPI0031F730E5